MTRFFNNIHPALLILFACALWGSDLIVRSPLAKAYSADHIIFWEALSGLMLFAPIALIKLKSDFFKFNYKEFLALLFLGVMGSALAGELFTQGLQNISSGTFSILHVFQPLMGVLIAHFFLNEKANHFFINWGPWVVLSALLIESNEIELSVFLNDVSTQGRSLLMAFGSIMIWAFCTSLGKWLLARMSALKVLVWRWLFAFIYIVFVGLFSDKTLPHIYEIANFKMLWRVFYIGAFAGHFGLWVYYLGLKKMSATSTYFLEISYPAFGMLFFALFNYNDISVLQLIGVISLCFVYYSFINQHKKISLGPLT